jgi:hypothetical protein
MLPSLSFIVSAKLPSAESSTIIATKNIRVTEKFDNIIPPKTK